MIQIRKTFFVLIFSLFFSLNLFSAIEETSFSRKDQSMGTAYVSTPDNSESFPLVIYIDGSIMQSVKNNFSVLSFLFNQKNIGLVAIEKRGISKEGIRFDEFQAYDHYENRLEDHIQFVGELNTRIHNWNGQLIFIGSSEGGKIAPQLSLHFADKTMGTILIGSGGGLPFGEEIKYQIKQIAIENRMKFDEFALDQKIENQFSIILNHPFSLRTYYDKTYQWYASYLNYNILEDLLRIHTPILMIHGVLDAHIPVESADIIKTHFDLLGKENLTYLRFDDLGHSIGRRPDIFMILLNYSSEHFITEVPMLL